MTGKQPRDISASVRARLMTVAKFNNEAFDLVLVRFAIERLLYRLSRSPYHEQFVVKGAMMPPAIAALQGIAFSRFWQASVGWVEK